MGKVIIEYYAKERSVNISRKLLSTSTNLRLYGEECEQAKNLLGIHDISEFVKTKEIDEKTWYRLLAAEY